MGYAEEQKKRLEEEYMDSLERFKAEYFDLCYKQIQLEEEVIKTMKRIKVLEALIAFYGSLEKKGEENGRKVGEDNGQRL